MAALTANRDSARQDGKIRRYPAGVDILYRGGLAIINSSGYAVAGADTAGAKFGGVIYEKIDNSGGSAGDKNVRLQRDGIHHLAIASAAITDIGRPVWIADDQTVQIDPGNVFCGIIAERVSATEVGVDIEPATRFTRKRIVTANIVRGTAGDVDYAVAYIAQAGFRVLAADVVAIIVPSADYTPKLNLLKYDLSATTDDALLETADYAPNALTAKQRAALTLQTTTPANLDGDDGDVVYISLEHDAAGTTLGEGVAVSFEIAEEEG